MLSLINGVASTTALTQINIIPPALFSIPVGFDKWSPSFDIYEHVNGSFSTDFDITSVKPSGVVAYVAKDGDDVSGDGSEASPYRTLDKAEDIGAVEIRIKPGHYNRADGFADVSFRPQRSMALVAAEGAGSVIISRAYDTPTWVQQAAPNDNVYLFTKGGGDPAVSFVLDLSADGRVDEYLLDGVSPVPIPVDDVSSVADCQANAGSIYINGDDLYMHTHDSRAPDADVVVLPAEGLLRFIDGTNRTLYLEGLELWGRGTIRCDFDSANTNIIAAKNCGSRFSDWTIGLVSIRGVSKSYLENVQASDCTSTDAIGYNASSLSVRVDALEVNCKARRSGSKNALNGNGSTSHSNCAVIRMNGDYQSSYGPVVADVLGAHSLNLNCLSGNSSVVSNILQKAAFNVGTVSSFDSSNSKMWNKNCRSVGREYDRVQSSGGEMFDLGGFVGENNKDHGTIVAL